MIKVPRVPKVRAVEKESNDAPITNSLQKVTTPVPVAPPTPVAPVPTRTKEATPPTEEKQSNVFTRDFTERLKAKYDDVVDECERVDEEV